MVRIARTLELLAAAFERLAIPYAIAGSVASSARGSYRATENLDLVAGIAPDQAGPLTEALGTDWYADRDQIRAAVSSGRAFNLIYIPFSQKADIFPAHDDFSQGELQRATRLPIPSPEAGAAYPTVSAENIVLAKLTWYRSGGETSERQWTDILGVIAATPAMDWEYVNTWAARLGVAPLLDRARAEP